MKLPAASAAVEQRAIKTGKIVNRAPAWARGGSFAYRICTTDSADCLRYLEEGLTLTHHLLDGSIRQIPICNGLVGDDHPGGWNWDGLWPYWNRVTFRARDWPTLRGFMQRVKEKANTAISFHVNLTDVNAGLRDFPETREFFQKLVATGSMYARAGRKSWPHTYTYPPYGEYDTDPPYILREIPEKAVASIEIISLVNYKNFWDSGLAKEMIDTFYSHLPYPPPILYLDVLTLGGSNFSVGFPDGPLGGSEGTQLEGVRAIAEYLRSKGTDIATEGDRREISTWATYGWLHCSPGISSDDYSYIAGATRYLPMQHVAGNTGCFVTSPIAATAPGLERVRRHYARLLAGEPGAKPTPGLETCHIAYPVSTTATVDIPGVANEWLDPFSNTTCRMAGEYDIPGAGDPFRGDWVDLVNNFYLTGIQELYHIGKGNVRTAVFNRTGRLYVSTFTFVDSTSCETLIHAADCVPADQASAVRKAGRHLLGKPLEIRFNAPQAGAYQFKFHGYVPGHEPASLNLYVNGEWQRVIHDIAFPSGDSRQQEFSLGEIVLQAGENVLALDAGPIFMEWSDGTKAIWTTPYLGRGFKVANGEVVFADDYDRMWPDSWSGQKKIYFFSWDGTHHTWLLPPEWKDVPQATLYPLTPDGRGAGTLLPIKQGTVAPKILPQVPYVLVA